jgi:hypothetical protein
MLVFTAIEINGGADVSSRSIKMKLPRRNFLHLAAGAAALQAMPRIARAQGYPARPVRSKVIRAANIKVD